MSQTSDDATVAALVEVLYTDLRRLAHRQRHLRGGASETLRTTALVNEAYMKLSRGAVFANRGHFLATAGIAMRQVLMNHARARLSAKRGSGIAAEPLDDEIEGLLPASAEQLVALDAALTRLEAISPRCARVVECRYFAGLSEIDTALALGVTDRTVQRDWAKAKALLYEALEPR